MRFISLLGMTILLTAPALAQTLEPGIYPCRTLRGTETGSSFVIGEGGRYGDNPGTLDGTVDYGMGEVHFDGGGNDGKFARVISDTRVKIGKRVFCNWEEPLPAPAAAPEPEPEPAAPEPPGAKLIVVKPDQRR